MRLVLHNAKAGKDENRFLIGIRISAARRLMGYFVASFRSYLQVRLMDNKVGIGWFASCAIVRMLFMPGSEQGDPSSIHVLNSRSKFACDIGGSAVAVNTLKPMNAVTSARTTIVLGYLTFIVLSMRHLEFRLTRALASGLPACSTAVIDL
jgi:hypothetical protein